MRKFTLLWVMGMLMAFQLFADDRNRNDDHRCKDERHCNDDRHCKDDRHKSTTLIPFGSTWKYLDNGSDQGTAWQAPAFDDAAWKAGPAILGYGNPPYNNRGEATKLSFGPDPNNTYITAYFRKTINLTTAYAEYHGVVKRDDGVVVYVNGIEVFRNNLPKGPVAYRTLASYAQDNGMKELDFHIPKSAFVTGNNVIAVEVHQHSKSSSDLTFDLKLRANRPIQPQEQKLTIIPFKSVWKYLQNGSDQGSAWTALGFDDASWPSGPAILGYGNPPYNDRGEATKLSRSTDPHNPYITTYFRKTINLTTAYESFYASVRRDDGVVVYVNGVEVFRDFIRKGPVNYRTLADFSHDNGMKKIAFSIPGTAFTLGNNVIAVEVHQHTKSDSDLTFDFELIGKGPKQADIIPPSVLSLNRQVPTSQVTNATTLTFRATFSEAVTGVDAADFSLAFTGTTRGTIGTVTPVGTDGKTFDIQVTGVIGAGTVGLNLNATGTGIADIATNPLTGGITGQTYSILEGFVTVTPLTPLAANADATREKQQAKVFVNDGRHFSVIADADGTHLWRLDGTTWVKQLTLSSRNNRADAVVDGNLTHVLLYGGSPATIPPNLSQFITLEYVPATQTYKPWSVNPGLQSISLDNGVETASLAKDGTDRLWVASAGVSDINVRWSDAPYTTWSAPITIATGVNDDDIAAAVYIGAQGKIGVMWSNQNTDRFGFKTHTDGTAPTLWSADEVPASQSALPIGGGIADDHLNLKVATDGTVYAAVKTSYDTPGTTEIALLVRRPTGLWDNLYEVAQNGPVSTQDPTLPIVVLNETLGKIRVIYTSRTNGGDILYKESAVSNIAFGTELTLIAGVNNFVTSTNQNFSTNIVILASNATQVVGVLASDVLTPLAPLVALAPETGGKAKRQDLAAFPNPFTTRATLRFALAADGAYSLTLYESNGSKVVYQQKGSARAGALTSLELDGASLKKGLYYARLQTADGVKTLRLLLDK